MPSNHLTVAFTVHFLFFNRASQKHICSIIFNLFNIADHVVFVHWLVGCFQVYYIHSGFFRQKHR